MTVLKLIKWLAGAIVTLWLVFIIVFIYGGGEPFPKMGESTVSSVQNITPKLSAKADMIKRQPDEWKEKITGKKSEDKEVQESTPRSEPQENKPRKTGAAVKQAPTKTGGTQ